MTAPWVGERPVKAVRWEWSAPDEATERDSTIEMVAALSAFVGTWIDPLVIEANVGCYDREIFTEGKTEPAQRFQLLARETLPPEIEVRPSYVGSVESRAPSLSPDVVARWIDAAVAQPCGDPARFETSLRQLDLTIPRVPAPSDWAGVDVLTVECYAGAVEVPLSPSGAITWVGAPPIRFGLHPPFTVTIQNDDGACRFGLDIYWTPWVGELTRPESPMAQAVTRLVARGWEVAAD
ncbi:MAG: hypothetical protein ABL886_13580 [Rhodoglobus sp.]